MVKHLLMKLLGLVCNENLLFIKNNLGYVLNITLFKAPIEISFSITKEEDYDYLKREYDGLGESDDDPIGNWVKVVKSKGNSYDTDPLLLHLIVEMHRKIDRLEQIIENKQVEYIPLNTSSNIVSVGYEYFKLNDNNLEDDKRYYGRIIMPVFPKRHIAIFFTKHKDNIAKIDLMHDRDIKEWDFYVASRERAMIREKKNVD